MQKIEIYTFDRREVGYEELWRKPAVLVDAQLFDEIFSVKGDLQETLMEALRHTMMDEGEVKYGVGPSLLSVEDWKFADDRHSVYRGFRNSTDPINFRRKDGFTFRRAAMVRGQASLVVEASTWRQI